MCCEHAWFFQNFSQYLNLNLNRMSHGACHLICVRCGLSTNLIKHEIDFTKGLAIESGMDIYAMSTCNYSSIYTRFYYVQTKFRNDESIRCCLRE
jgi:hypothetical protein